MGELSRRRELRPRSRRPEPAWVRAALAALALVSTLILPHPCSAQDRSLWTKPRADLRVELGVDSSQRRFYRPDFSFSLPFDLFQASRAYVSVSYLERLGGSLKGTTDYWIKTGFETLLSGSFSAEVGLAHFCRHLTSIFNPRVLYLNELLGRVWMRRGRLAVGLGFGPFVGGSPGFRELMIADFNLSGFFLPEITLESELKWVDFERFYYGAGLAVTLAQGAEIFIRTTRDYDYAPATYIGIRLGTEGAPARIVDRLDIEMGYYPFYDRHKLLFLGGFRLGLLDRPDRRFFVDVDFRTPILHGTSLFAQSYPDRMLYDVEAQYEKPLAGGLYGAWYARYSVDLPTDKPVHFRSSLSTGLALRNQPDYNRLDKPVRFEIEAGYDFVFDYDLRLRLAGQIRPRRLFPVGAELRVDANSERRTIEFKAFAALGKVIEVRPFVGVRKVSYLAGPVPPEDDFLNRVTTGIALFSWF